MRFRRSVVHVLALAGAVLTGSAASSGEPVDQFELSPLLMSRSPGYKEMHLAEVLGRFRREAGEDQVIDGEDLRLRELLAEANRRALVTSQFMSRDLDDDGYVTRSEISVSAGSAGSSISQDAFDRADRNEDGTVSIREWKESTPLGT